MALHEQSYSKHALPGNSRLDVMESHPLYRTLCRPYHACLVGSVRATERWELLSHEQNVDRWYCMQLYTFILPVHNIYIM